MAFNTFIIWTVVAVISASLIFVTSISANAGWSGVLAGTPEKIQENGKKAPVQPCPGCDADVPPGSCGGEISEAAAGVRIPYGPGAYRYRDFSGINNANRSLGRSMRNLNDSIRRMDTSINRMRNIKRRF